MAKFYVSSNICYFDDHGFAKKKIDFEFYNSDASVIIWKKDNSGKLKLGKSKPIVLHDGAITDLTESDGVTPYANRAALVTVLDTFLG